MRDQHISSLPAITNDVLQQLTPNTKQRFGGAFEELVSSTKRAINELGAQLVEDIPPIAMGLKGKLDEADRDEILRICNRYVRVDVYEKRLTAFKESFERRMRGYGMTVNLSEYRFDLIEARYTAGAANAARGVVGNLRNALDLHVYADQPATQSDSSARGPSFLEEANEIVDLKPNFFGIGINFNRLIRRFTKWRK
jgi:hypothetical protein